MYRGNGEEGRGGGGGGGCGEVNIFVEREGVTEGGRGLLYSLPVVWVLYWCIMMGNFVTIQPGLYWMDVRHEGAFPDPFGIILFLINGILMEGVLKVDEMQGKREGIALLKRI